MTIFGDRGSQFQLGIYESDREVAPYTAQYDQVSRTGKENIAPEQCLVMYPLFDQRIHV